MRCHSTLPSLGVACVATIAVVAATVTPAAAQRQSPRDLPVSRLPSTGASSGPSHSLDLSGHVSAGFDQLSTTGLDGTELSLRRGAAEAASVSLGYGFSRNWFAGSLTASSAGRRFSGTDSWSFLNYGGGSITAVAPMNTRNALSGRASLSYQPVSASTLFPDLFRTGGPPALPTEFDLATELDSYLASDADVTYTRLLSRRSTFTAGYAIVSRGAITGNEGVRTDTASAGLSRAMTPSLSLRLGYGYGRSRNTLVVDVDSAAVIETHHLDLGVDYSKTFNISRQTTFGFGTGSIAVSDGNRTRIDAIGHADLARRFGRTWESGVSYSRDVDFVQTFSQPAFSDSVAASITGRAASLVAVRSGTGVSFGRVGLGPDASDYRATQATAGLTVSIGRLFDISADYAYYRYRFDGAMQLSPGLGQEARRHFFQIGTGITLPLINRARTPNAPR
jgi:hypothetical protein